MKTSFNLENLVAIAQDRPVESVMDKKCATSLAHAGMQCPIPSICATEIDEAHTFLAR